MRNLCASIILPTYPKGINRIFVCNNWGASIKWSWNELYVIIDTKNVIKNNFRLYEVIKTYYKGFYK